MANLKKVAIFFKMRHPCRSSFKCTMFVIFKKNIYLICFVCLFIFRYGSAVGEATNNAMGAAGFVLQVKQTKLFLDEELKHATITKRRRARLSKVINNTHS